MAVSYLLARAGMKVTLLEAAPQAGGVLATFDVGSGRRLEHFYHHFFTHDAEIAWLLDELGLSDRVVYRRSSMGMFRGGRLYPFDGVGDLLRFRAIGLLSRLRFGASSALLAWFQRYTRQEDVACLRWFERYAGAAATDAIWRPMLNIKFGDAADSIPLAWMAGRLRQRVQSRRRGVEQLGYLKGSLQVLVDEIIGRLTDLGVDIRLGTPALSLVTEGNRIRGVATHGGGLFADQIVSTLPTEIASGLVRPAAPAYADRLAGIEYMGAICTVLSLREPLSSIYWTNVADPGYDFGGIIEHTNLVPPDEYDNRHLVYLSRYVRRDHPLWQMDAEQLVERQSRQLEAISRRQLQSLVQRSWVFRARCAAPITDLGFFRKIPTFQSPLDGFYLASMCHVYPDERSVNNSIRVAAEVVRAMGFAELADQVPHGVSLAGKYGAGQPIPESLPVAGKAA